MLDVLVVDDDDIVRGSICKAISEAGHCVVEASDGEKALSLLTSRTFDLALCDVQMPRMDGLSLFRRLRQDFPGTAVVIMTSFGAIPDAVASLRGGAVDYVLKPFDPEEFVANIVGPIADRRALMKKFEEARMQFVAKEAGMSLVGTSVVMRRLVDRIAAAATGDAPVFISGDSGSGKNLVARILHAKSARRDGPFLVVPCVSLSGLMLESESRDRSEGRSRSHRDAWFRAAEGGTLVLDGVDTLSFGAQCELLRVLDEPGARARSDPKWQPRGVRLISISQTHPVSMVAHRGFLEGLLFRLSTLEVRVPSLGERDGDLHLLVYHFLRAFTPAGRKTPGVSIGAWKALSSYGFPGNVRELAWAVEHAVANANGGEIDLHHLPDKVGVAFAP